MPVMASVMAAIALVGAVVDTRAKNEAAANQINSLNKQRAIQAQQINDQTSVEMQQATETARRQRALIAVAAGAGGVDTNSGSIEAMMSNSLFQEDRNQALRLKANKLQQEGAQAQAESIYNQIKPEPSWVQALKIGSTTVSAYRKGLDGGGWFAAGGI